MPDEPYGVSKRAVELVGGALAKKGTFEFVSLRIAIVIGPGINLKTTSSLWRSQIFEIRQKLNAIQIPFSPEAVLPLVHVEDVASMLATLADAPKLRHSVYNTPVETWEARQLKEIIEELRRIQVDLGSELAHGGPMCDGSRFAREFGFKLRGLRDRFSDSTGRNQISFS